MVTTHNAERKEKKRSHTKIPENCKIRLLFSLSTISVSFRAREGAIIRNSFQTIPITIFFSFFFTCQLQKPSAMPTPPRVVDQSWDSRVACIHAMQSRPDGAAVSLPPPSLPPPRPSARLARAPDVASLSFFYACLVDIIGLCLPVPGICLHGGKK